MSTRPPGCWCHSGSNKYKCICKTKTCIKCPINTYSEGGTNPTCTKCPKGRPYTFLNKQDSIDSCTSKKDAVKCEAGEEGSMTGTSIRTSGPPSQCSGLSKITTEAECELAAEYNMGNNIAKNRGYRGRVSYSERPP